MIWFTRRSGALGLDTRFLPVFRKRIFWGGPDKANHREHRGKESARRKQNWPRTMSYEPRVRHDLSAMSWWADSYELIRVRLRVALPGEHWRGLRLRPVRVSSRGPG